MKEITATQLKQNLFKVLKETTASIPTRIRYKMDDLILIPYHQYLKLKNNKPIDKLTPLIKGKILKPLGKQANEKLWEYLYIGSWTLGFGYVKRANNEIYKKTSECLFRARC